jgi:hypothetical protein
MSRGFSLIHYHVACGLCREMTWSQSRDLILKAKIHVYDHVEPERLLYCRQTPKWCQNEQRLFCDKHTDSTWTSDLSSRKSATSETTYALCRQLLSLHKSDFNRLIRRTWHAPYATPTLFAWFDPQWLLLVSYSERKTRTDSGGWRGPVFESLQEILMGIDQEESNCIFQVWVRRVQEVSQGKAKETTSDDKYFFIYIGYVQFHQTGWRMYLSTRRYRLPPLRWEVHSFNVKASHCNSFYNWEKIRLAWLGVSICRTYWTSYIQDLFLLAFSQTHASEKVWLWSLSRMILELERNLNDVHCHRRKRWQAKQSEEKHDRSHQVNISCRLENAFLWRTWAKRTEKEER